MYKIKVQMARTVTAGQSVIISESVKMRTTVEAEVNKVVEKMLLLKFVLQMEKMY